MTENQNLNRRKEPRFKTRDAESLTCDCSVEENDPNQGTIVDISASGLRLLCDEKFTVGQTFTTELKTDCSHGTYRGVIRRVEPWMGGRFILGCQLTDTIPSETLESLAQQGVINRRCEDRVDWNQPAKMSWELQPGEIDIEMQNCSTGGLKVTSQTDIPEDVRLRIRVDVDGGESIVVDAKTVWKQEQDDQCVAGLAFTKRELPEVITQILEQDDQQPEAVTGERTLMRRGLLVATAVVVFGLALLEIGLR